MRERVDGCLGAFNLCSARRLVEREEAQERLGRHVGVSTGPLEEAAEQPPHDRLDPPHVCHELGAQCLGLVALHRKAINAEKALRDRGERALGPQPEPVDRASIDNCREKARLLAQLVAGGREAENDVEVAPHAVGKERVQLGIRRLHVDLMEGRLLVRPLQLRVEALTIGVEEAGQLTRGERLTSSKVFRAARAR